MMDIKPEHKELLKSLGLKEEDFSLFDGKDVRYEVDEEKGVRIYDPYYTTSYDEYNNCINAIFLIIPSVYKVFNNIF